MENKLKISVVTVCYNAVDSIEETMLSVLNQTYPHVEYIVIDGGSTDGTVDIIKKYADHLAYWVSEPDRGIYDAMNKGIAAATGDYINFMNAGDKLYSTDTIENLIVKIQNLPTIIYGDTIIKKKNGLENWKTGKLENIKKNMIFCHQSTLIRLDYHKRNKFDINFKLAGDYNFLLNAYKNNESFLYVPLCVSIFNACNNGASTKYHKQRIREKCKIWGISNKPLLRLKYEILIVLLQVQDKLPLLKRIKNRLLNRME